MKDNILLFLFLIPTFLFAQYPTGSNKSRLGYQTTGDGLIWRGVAADTSVKPRTTANAYFQLDTVNGILRRYIATRGKWQTVSGGSSALTMPFDSIYFTPSNVEPDTAELKYSQDLETLVFGADGTTVEIGQKEAWYVKNQTGSTIAKGTVVRAVGTLGSSGRILVSPMVADGTISSKYLLGITASSIANGADGYVIHFGKLRNTNTNSWNEGDVLYASATTPGALTNVEPAPPNLRLPIAFVVHKHATNGVLAIRVQTGNELHELHDVDTTGINNNEVLVYNSTLNKWQASNGAALTTADTTSQLATKYWTNSNFFPLQGGTLTGTGGAGFVGFPSQVTAPGTPASGLNVYAQGSAFNWKGTDGYERQFASTLTGGRTYTLPNASGTFALGTGTATRIPIWTSANALGDSPALYNSSTKRWTWDSPSILELPMGTTAQRPSPATTSDFWYNTTIGGAEIYDGSDWYYVNPWKQSTSSSNVFLNSGSAIVNSSSVLNSLYKLQVNGGALYSGATFTTTATNQAALDIRSLNLTAASGTTHALWGINIEGSMTFNTANQIYGGLRIATTSNATSSQSVLPIDISFSASQLGGAKIINTNASGGAEWIVGGAGSSAPERVVIRSPNGGTSANSVPGYNYLSTAGSFGWAISGGNSGLQISSNISGVNPNAVNPTFQLRNDRVLIGRRALTTPTATLEITGEGATNSTKTFLVQNSGRANNAFIIFDDGTSVFGSSSVGLAALVTFTSTTQGILPPRWTAVQRAAISSPATGLFGYQTNGTEGVYFKQASAWKRLLWEGDAVSSNIYTADGTFGSGRIGTLTDSLRFRFGSNDLFRLKSNGVLHVNMPTESNSFVITSTPSENYNNFRGNVYVSGTASSGDTLTNLTRRNNHDASYFSGINLIEGGNNVYYDAVAGYGNVLRGDKPKNIVFGVYNTLNGNDDNVFGRANTVNGNDIGVFGQANTVTQNSAFIYGNFGNSSVNRHGFGTVTPGARIHAKSLSGVPTILADGGEVQANAYGVQAKEASDLSKTVGNIAAFATDGTLLDYRITRDTSTSNADFTVTSTLLSSCQELFISAEVTSSATDTVNIILPTPSATYKNNKVYVFGDDDSSTQWVAVKSANATGLYYSNGGVKPTETNYAAVTTTTGVSGVTYVWICTRRNSGTWNWVLVRQ